MTFKQREIEEVIEEEKRLPSTHRHGFNRARNDVAEGADGSPPGFQSLKLPKTATTDHCKKPRNGAPEPRVAPRCQEFTSRKPEGVRTLSSGKALGS